MIHTEIRKMLQAARKANDEVGVQVLSLIMTEFTNREKEAGSRVGMRIPR